MSAQEKIERIEVRVSAKNKQLIEHAAAAKGHASISGFAAVELIQSAKEILEDQEVLTLSNRDRDRFLEILDNQQPNDELIRAARDYLTHSPIDNDD